MLCKSSSGGSFDFLATAQICIGGFVFLFSGSVLKLVSQDEKRWKSEKGGRANCPGASQHDVGGLA